MTDDERERSLGGSTIEFDDQQPPSPTRPDPRSSLQHVLEEPIPLKNTPSGPRRKREIMEDEEMMTPGGMATEAPAKPSTSRKRKEPAQGANNPAYANKVKHLKKDDGEPLWRRDIQFDFLKDVFENDQRVFTNSYEPDKPQQSFADLYIDTMARSSKTSKILRDKLLTEHEPAKNMAMVCLLVNLGRMNTTLNCKYERPVLRNMLMDHSLPRNASTTPNVSCYSLTTGASRPELLQAASRRSATEVNFEGGF